jgi:NAD-dependent DNA ligase
MTGEFDDFSKDELSELLTSYGARVTKSVSKKTTILLAGTKLEDGRDVNTSRKYQQALKLGTKIMDIYAFTDYFKEISKGIELKDLKSSSLSA